jgi:hypothetical protein
MISSTLKIAAALPIKPIFEVFSRKCGVSEITDAGIAIASFFFFILPFSFMEKGLRVYVQLKS